MKKIFFFAACAAALLTSCSQEEEIVKADVATDQAINFTAYTQTANAARGTVVDAAGVDEIGVFAFYQPAATGDFTTYKYATPDFMYNQKVADDGTGNWEYSPLKYWPNNAGDKLSFFAYAPYNAAKTWEDLGVKTDVNGTKMTLTFPIYPDVKDQQDYLYAAPVLNQAKQSTTGNVAFTFDHITSQVNLYAGVEVDEDPATGDDPMAWSDADTEIEIKSIEFTDLSSSIIYTIPTGGALTTTFGSKQNIVMSGADFVTTAALINTTNYAAAQYYQLNATDAVMFLAPEAMSKAIMTYTVTTTDAKLPGGKSVITNVAEADLSALTLAAGKVYNLKFLIGMTSVKLTASVNAWDGTATDEVIVLPVKNY